MYFVKVLRGPAPNKLQGAILSCKKIVKAEDRINWSFGKSEDAKQ